MAEALGQRQGVQQEGMVGFHRAPAHTPRAVFKKLSKACAAPCEGQTEHAIYMLYKMLCNR